MKTIYIREEIDGVIKVYDINLTRMFGEGKEPSLREYINMFPPVSYNTNMGNELEQAAIDYGMRCYKRGFMDGKEWQKKQEPTWKKTEPEPNMSYVLCFKGGGVIDTCDYRERTKRFYYEDGEYNSSVPYNSDTLIGWMYRLELEKLPKE